MLTLLIVAATTIISLLTMQNEAVKNRFMFNAYAISKHREWWRFFTHGVLHADYLHLLFNMISLYSVGKGVELMFNSYFGVGKGELFFLLLYVTALPMSSLFTYFRQRDNRYYNALGASGAVLAVIFTLILLAPTAQLSFFYIPMPGWLFGILFLVASWLLSRYNPGFLGNVAHEAHFFGAVWGFFFPCMLDPELMHRFVSIMKAIYYGVPMD